MSGRQSSGFHGTDPEVLVMLDLHRPTVQISLDLQTLDEAMATARIAVEAGVDWIEVGTPLILAEGLHAVRALHQAFPDRPLIADLKTMDGGYLEAEMMFRAGATFVVVMSRAHPRTIEGAIRAGKEFGGMVMGDIMLEPDKPAAARRLEALGIDVVILHTGYDERHAEPGASPLDDLAAVRAAVATPIQAVGGLSIDQAVQCVSRGAPLVVIGAPLAIADEEFRAGGDDQRLREVLRSVVHRVKGDTRD